MPYTEKDVERHNKGLSTKQKKQWVAVANSVLAKCKEDGGEENSCAASAVQQANGVVKGNSLELENYSNMVAADYQIQTRAYQGKQQIIVPVVMMVEGVHCGSHGPLLHLAEDLGKFPASWDGIPVMIGHPEIEGFSVSANSPEVLEASVGRVFHTYFEDSKLKAEVWLDEQRILAISPTALSYIQNGRQLEVSIGVFTDDEEEAGVYINSNGEEESYTAIARNHRPDHLALLPGESGACGWSDGCGIRVNSNTTLIKEKEDEEMKTESILAMRQIASEDIIASITDNKQGYQELMGKISEKLYANDSPEEYNMLEEVYEGSVVYRKRSNNPTESGFYQQSYAVNEDGSVDFLETPTRVRREVSYVQINVLKRTIFHNNKKGDPKMDKPCCIEKVNALINNSLTSFTEDDREWLLNLGAEKLEKLTPKTLETSLEVNKAAEPVQVDLTGYVKKDSLKTTEDFLAIAPAEVQDQLRSGLRLHQSHRNELVQSILDNSEKEVWTKEELGVFDTAMLEKLNKQFKPQVNYAGKAAGGTIQTDASDDAGEILMPIV